jgi:acyl carrier protein
MNDKIIKAVNDAINDVFKPQNSPAHMELIKQDDFKFEDLSDSSLTFVEFCMQVEESLGIEIEFFDLMENPTLKEFLVWLEQQKIEV